MSQVTTRLARTVLTLLVAVLGVLGLAGASVAAPAPATLAGPVAAPPCGDTSSYDRVPLGELPPEATDTVELIEQGGPYPYPQDGTVFENREELLPDCEIGYYHEYTVETPGSPDRGARRIVTGSAGEHFYTEDHYQSFVLIDLGGAACGDPSHLDSEPLSGLPAEVADTLALIEAGGPYPYPQDGIVYENREGVLPTCAPGYYHLYTVPTPGSDPGDRGERRVITGADGDRFYTPDRYRTFVLIELDS